MKPVKYEALQTIENESTCTIHMLSYGLKQSFGTQVDLVCNTWFPLYTVICFCVGMFGICAMVN